MPEPIPVRPDMLAYHERMTAITARIPADILADLFAAHEGYGADCMAHSEGWLCCVDYMNPDVRMYTAERKG